MANSKSHLYAGSTGGSNSGHYDWSLIEEKYINTHEVITILREPVNRAISHFNYAKLQKWTTEDYKNKTLADFLKNPAEMMKMRERITIQK